MIEVSNVYLKYKLRSNKYKYALSGIDFKFKNHGCYFIYGKSGCGKSSFLSVLSGINIPTKGNIYINNQDIYNFKEKEINEFYSNIGFLFQDCNLIENLTIDENINLILKEENRTYYQELLNKLRLNHLKNKSINLLSGGEKQRVALIRAFVNHPSIIFADEPTGALDKENGDLLISLLLEVSKKALVIIVTHNEKYLNIENANYIFMEDGKIKESIIDNEEKDLSINFSSKKSNLKYLFKNIFRKNFLFSIINFLVVFFVTFVSFFSFSFKTSLNEFNKTIFYQYEAYNVFEVSKNVNKLPSSSSISVFKKELPNNIELISFLESYDLDTSPTYNFKYFFENSKTYINEKEFVNLKYLPTFNEDLIDNEILINEAFANKYNLNINDYLTLDFEKEISFYLNKEQHKELLSFEKVFKIKEIIKEFNFMEEARIYYSYQFFYNFLNDIPFLNDNSLNGEVITTLNLFNFLNDEHEIHSYSLILNFNDEDYQKIIKNQLIDEFNENNYVFTNESYLISDAFIKLTSSLNLSINIFLILILISSFALLIFLNVSSIISSKKENALFKFLGFSSFSISLPILIKNLFILLLGSISSYFLLNLFFDKIFHLIQKIIGFNLNLILDFKISLIFFLLLILIICGSNFINYKLIKEISIYKELKEE